MTSRRRRAQQLAIVIVGALVVLGLSHFAGNDAPTTGKDRRTAPQYRKLQNSVCRQQLRALGEVPAPRRPGEFAGYLEELVSTNRPYVDRAEGIIPPRGAETLHKRYIAANSKAQSETQRLIRQVRTTQDPGSALRRWTKQVEPITRESNAVVAELGLTACQPALLPKSDEGSRPDPPASTTATCRDLDREKQAVRDEITLLAQDAREGQKTVDGLEEEVRSYPEDRSKIAPDLRTARGEVQDSRREIGKSRQNLEDLNEEAREEGCGR